MKCGQKVRFSLAFQFCNECMQCNTLQHCFKSFKTMVGAIPNVIYPSHKWSWRKMWKMIEGLPRVWRGPVLLFKDDDMIKTQVVLSLSLLQQHLLRHSELTINQITYYVRMVGMWYDWKWCHGIISYVSVSECSSQTEIDNEPLIRRFVISPGGLSPEEIMQVEITSVPRIRIIGSENAWPDRSVPGDTGLGRIAAGQADGNCIATALPSPCPPNAAVWKSMFPSDRCKPVLNHCTPTGSSTYTSVYSEPVENGFVFHQNVKNCMVKHLVNLGASSHFLFRVKNL